MATGWSGNLSSVAAVEDYCTARDETYWRDWGEPLMPVPTGIPIKLVMTQNNTQLIQLSGLRDSDNNFVNNATMSASLIDPNREPVNNCTNISMSYVASSNGDYQGTVPATFEPLLGSSYTLIIDADNGSAHLHLEIPTEIKVRTF